MKQAEKEDSEFKGIAREVAGRLNPLIGLFSADETLTNCAEVADFIAIAAPSIENSGGADFASPLYPVLSALSAALRYEVEQVGQEEARKHKRGGKAQEAPQ